MESKYLTQFTNVKDFKLNGARLLIEVMPPEEIKSAGGLIVAAPSGFAKGSTADTCRATLAIVLLIGEGYVDAEGTEYESTVKPGAVVMVNDFSVRTFSTFPGLRSYTANTLAVIDENNIQMQWESLEQFKSYEEKLNNG